MSVSLEQLAREITALKNELKDTKKENEVLRQMLEQEAAQRQRITVWIKDNIGPNKEHIKVLFQEMWKEEKDKWEKENRILLLISNS